MFHRVGEDNFMPGMVPDQIWHLWINQLTFFYINRWKQP